MFSKQGIMKRLSVGALILAMTGTSLLTGCSGSASNAGSQTTEAQVTKDTEQAKTTEAESTAAQSEAVSSEPVTIKILSQLRSLAKNVTLDDIYIWHYLEYYMRQQGYNVTIEMEDAGADPGERMSLLLNTGDLPDIVIGIGLSNVDAVNYGVNEGMLLDWLPYLNDSEIMPNANALLTSNPEYFEGVICPDGKIYSLPGIEERTYLWLAGNLGGSEVYVNGDWLEACHLEPPQTSEELLDMMRAFSEKKKAEGGDGVVYIEASKGSIENSIWSGLGFYGSGLSQFGTTISIKDGKVELPAATEDYRTFIEIMHSMYSEGLISQDYFTIDTDTAASMGSTLKYPMVDAPFRTMSDPEAFKSWINMPPFTVGNNTTVVKSVNSNVTTGNLWASAETEHPEIVAKMMDFFYDKQDGVPIWLFGPKKGEDPLGLVEGWTVKDGKFTCKEVEDGNYENWDAYAQNHLIGPYPSCTLGVGYADSRNEDGSPKYLGTKSYVDPITGKEVEMVIKAVYTDDTIDGAIRLKKEAQWATDPVHVTTVRLPSVYLDGETARHADELSMLIGDQIKTESVNFITGKRPLSELDQYFEEIKSLGVDEFVEIYRNAYSRYIDSVFGD